MKINQEYNGTIIGGIFTVLSLLSILTFFVPILTVSFGSLIESLMSELVPNDPYSNVGMASLIFFSIVCGLSVTFVLVKAKKKALINKYIIGIMIAEFLFIHNLGYYIYWATALNFRGDGQLAIAIFYTFIFSSFAFLTLGILMDAVKPRIEIENENNEHVSNSK